jgi:hypothetical protein
MLVLLLLLLLLLLLPLLLLLLLPLLLLLLLLLQLTRCVRWHHSRSHRWGPRHSCAPHLPHDTDLPRNHIASSEQCDTVCS